MFHYFYLISLLLCINLVFSYEYIDDAPRRTFHRFGKNVKRVGMLGRRKDKKNQIRQEYSYDKNPVEFDLAGFIQPDEETVADEESVKRRNQLRRRRISKNNDYNSLLGLNMEKATNSRDINEDYLNLGDSQANLSPTLLNLSPPLLKDSMNIKKFKMNNMDDQNAKYSNDNFKHLLKNQIVLPEQIPAHNPQKKCVFKSIKFPFFSHNKTDSLKPKKAQKRKSYDLKDVKKSAGDYIIGKNKLKSNSIAHHKFKRSYEIRVCPACKKKYITHLNVNNRHKKTPVKIIHNSRQFFQMHPDVKIKENLNKNLQYNFGDPEALVWTDRTKREDPESLDKDRQLKLLDEIEKKVDSVKITKPKFTRTQEQ